MLRIENEDWCGFEHAMRGMRNPKDSWSKNDTYGDEIGDNDIDLAVRLAKGGPVHAKYRRMMVVYVDLVAPLYWWKEFDTYKIGTVANSCSTMHKIDAKPFDRTHFSCEKMNYRSLAVLDATIDELNYNRNCFLESGKKEKGYWWQMIQLLPSSYNQRRTVMMNYEVLANMYKWRRHHKLDEWHTFCDWVETLPYFNEIIAVEVKKDEE